MTQYRSLLDVKCIGSHWFSFLFVFSSKPDSVTSNSFPDFTWPWLELEAHHPTRELFYFWNLLKNGSDFGVWSIITRRWLLTDCYRLYWCDSGNWRYKLLEVEGDVKDRIYLNENCQRNGNFKRAGSEKVWWLVTFEYYTSCSTLARFKKERKTFCIF